MSLLLLTLAFAGCAATISSAQTVTLTVPGTSDPYLAGMPDGSTASSGDVAPDQSPAQVIGLPITPYSVLQFSATGLVRWNPNQPYWPPDGQNNLITTHLDVGAENGISDVTMPANALLGVFLGPSRPEQSPAPPALDFSTPASRDYLTVAPQLKQVFFIGDGRTSANIVQRVIVPVGATRLFLGTMDGRRWYTNDGEFMVQVSPEASLAIPRVGSSVLVTWSTTASFYTLYSCTNLSPPVFWQPLTDAAVVAGRFTVTNDVASPMRFFRLQGL